MNIFISGATGFIGCHLAKHLAEQGHCIHALYRNPNKMQLLNHPKIKPFKGDVNHIKSLEKAIIGCEQVYHLAAFPKVWAKDKTTFYRINVEGTDNVLKVCALHQVKKVVVTSTGGTLGPSYNNEIDENSPRFHPFFNEYEQTKAECEELVKNYVKKGLHVIIVNPTRVFGPGYLSDSNAVTTMIKLYCLGKFRFLPGNGKSYGNYVYIDDVVRGHILAMKNGVPGERYILGGENVTYLQFFGHVKSVSGKNYLQLKLPLFIMLIASFFMEMIAELTGKEPLITPKWVKKYNYQWKLSSQKAIKSLGYTITPLKKAIQETFVWLESQKK